VVFLNVTNAIGTMISNGTQWTGDPLTTLLVIFIFLFIIGIIFHIPMDILAGIMLIPATVIASAYSQFVIFLAILIISIAWIIARLWL
jgi:hypothetical protein